MRRIFTAACPTAGIINIAGSVRRHLSRLDPGDIHGRSARPNELVRHAARNSLALQNSTFNYVLLHPNVPKDSHYSLSPTFAVAVGSDGSFNATSQNGEAQMVGQITGSQLAGKINGTACNYAFTAEKS